MKRQKVCWLAAFAVLVISFMAGAMPGDLQAQETGSQMSPQVKGGFSYTSGQSIFKAYSYPYIPPPNLANSPKLSQLIVNNKLDLSLNAAIELALQNNLNIAVGRYQLPLAQLDVLRTKAGAAARGGARRLPLGRGQPGHRVGQGQVGGQRGRRLVGSCAVRGQRLDQVAEGAQGAAVGVGQHGSAQRDFQPRVWHAPGSSPCSEAASAHLLRPATVQDEVHRSGPRPTSRSRTAAP